MALRVMQVLAPSPVGGLERVVEMLARGLTGRGHRVTVAAVLDSEAEDHPFLEAMRGSGAEVVALPLPPRAYLRERRAIRSLCTSLAPHVVHTHGYRADVVASSAARAAGVAVVSTVHGFTGGGWKNRFYERLQRWAYRRADRVVAVSRPLGEALGSSGIPAGRIRVLPNAWVPGEPPLDRAEARRRLGLPEEGFVAGWVGRISREKGADVLVEAFAGVETPSGEVGVRLSVVGDGPLREELVRRSGESSPPGRFLWHGRVNGAAELFAAFDVFVLSSRTEGTPIALLEAMSAGVPVVATAVGGVPDVVSGDEAFLVPPERPDALREAILEVCRSPEEALRRADRAQARLRTERAPGPWLEAHERLYREVAGLEAEAGEGDAG